jgi:hypothetical protein
LVLEAPRASESSWEKHDGISLSKEFLAARISTEYCDETLPIFKHDVSASLESCLARYEIDYDPFWKTVTVGGEKSTRLLIPPNSFSTPGLELQVTCTNPGPKASSDIRNAPEFTPEAWTENDISKLSSYASLASESAIVEKVKKCLKEIVPTSPSGLGLEFEETGAKFEKMWKDGMKKYKMKKAGEVKPGQAGNSYFSNGAAVTSSV